MGKNPVAIFDSGVGGISVLQQVQQQLPFENLIYFADSAHAPYGDKTPADVEARAFTIMNFFEQQDAKAVVIACNTATAVAIDNLRARYACPIIGLEPAIKPATALQPKGVIAVLATANTLASEKYQRLKVQFAGAATIIDCACHGLVEYIEAGRQDSAEFYQLLSRYLQPLQNQHVDAIVLGCTHYPFMKPQLQQIIGHGVAIIDSAEAVARQLQRQLDKNQLFNNDENDSGQLRFYSNGVDENIVARLYQQALQIEMVDI